MEGAVNLIYGGHKQHPLSSCNIAAVMKKIQFPLANNNNNHPYFN